MTAGKKLTISIPTYNRSVKLERLLQQLLGIICATNRKDLLAIFVSNNASTDNTIDILNAYKPEFEKHNIEYSFISQAKNIGIGANFMQAYFLPETDYVWWFSDDDLLVVDDLDEVLNTLSDNTPNVMNIGFIQTPYTEKNPRYSPIQNGFVDGNTKYRDLLSTKLTATIIKKYELSKFSIDVDKLEKSYWSHVYLMLEVLFNHSRYFIYSKNIARCDEEYLDIRYSPDAFLELDSVFRAMYLKYGVKFSSELFGKTVTRASAHLNYYRMHLVKEVVLEDQVLLEIKQAIKEELICNLGIFKKENFRPMLSFLIRVLRIK